MAPETAAHQSLTSIKKEPADEPLELLDLSSQDLLDPSRILSEVGVDPSLLYQLPHPPTGTTSATIKLASSASSSVHPCSQTHDAIDPDTVPSPPHSPLSSSSSSSSPSPPPPPHSNHDFGRLPTILSPLLPDSVSSTSYEVAPGSSVSALTTSDVVPGSSASAPLMLPPYETPLFTFPPDATDIDAVIDSDSREQKAIIIASSEKATNLLDANEAKPVDRKGKGVDRSCVAPRRKGMDVTRSGAQQSQVCGGILRAS